MTFHPDADQIDRYLAGQLPPELHVRVEEWIAERPEHAAAIGLLRAKAQSASLERAPATERWLARLQADIATAADRVMLVHVVAPEPRLETLRLGSRSLRRNAVRRGPHISQWGIALALAVVVGIGITTIVRRRPSATGPGRTYTTMTGQRATITLADGSHVILAPQSRLVVSRDFGVDTRSVALVGEAYFDVASEAGASFIVQTGEVRTRVLGTVFDVRQYAGDRDVRVVVLSGKVQSRLPSHPGVTLTAGMIAHVSDSTTVLLTRDAAAQYVGWTRGRLEFHETPLPDVLATLERWYRVKFRLADSSLANVKLTGDLDNFRTTAGALNALEALLSVRMTYDSIAGGPVVTLHPQTAGAMHVPARRDPHHSFTTQQEVGR